MSTQNPPSVLEGQVVKTWLFSQNPDGSLSPANLGGGSTNQNVNLTGINGNTPGLGHPLAVELSDGTQAIGVGGNPLFVSGSLTDNNAAPSTNNLGALVAVASYADPGKTQGNLGTLSVDLAGYLRVRNQAESSLADSLITGQRLNQLEINFSIAFNATLITNSITTTGTATQANGCATYATGTGAAGEAKGLSVQTLNYRPGHEWYAYFTAAFAVGAASSHQRIGPFNATDGFWVGYEGTSFGISWNQNSSITTIAQASWNGDKCTGSAGSKFTNGGSPVALNPQKINIFRLRGSWFGVAPINFEALSPDGLWVVCHTFLFPNSLTAPYAYTTNWNMQVDVANTGNTSNLAITTACWALGTTDPTLPVNTAIIDQSLATLTRSVITGKLPSGSYSNVGLTPDSALSVGGSGSTSVNAVSWTSITTSAIAQVGGTSNQATTNVTTVSATYSPTASSTHAAVVVLNATAAITGVTVKDNLNNTLTAGPTISGTQYMFVQYPVPAGVTSYTATWTTGRNASITVEEYSGVGAVDVTPSGSTSSGTSTTASITVVPDEGSDWIVAGLGDGSNTLTGTVGNQRQQTTTSSARLTLMDTAGVTCTATLTSSGWTGTAIVLRPIMSGGTGLNTVLNIISNSFSYNSVAVQLVGSGTISGGTITGEVSVDNTNWIGIPGVNTATGLQAATAFSLAALANTGLVFNVTGYNYFRLRLSSQITGLSGAVAISYNIQGLASPNVSSTINTGTINVSSNQGTPNTIANAWPMMVTDSTNGPAAVKAASTASLATDPSLVVALSPNSPNNARAATTYPTAVADTAPVPLMADKAGRLVAVANAPRDLIGTAVVSNNSTASGVSFIGAGASGVYNDIITFIATNRSSTATVVTLTDGTASYTFAIAANGGIVVNFPTPLPATSAATAWTIGNSATVACDYIAVYAKNK